MNQNNYLAEAKRLYDLGFAIHWIRPNSKAPVKSGWTTGPRDSFETLKKEWRDGFGIGVRLGKASLLKGGGYLANIDMDIKSGSPEHLAQAEKQVEKLFPGLLDTAPAIKTGYGYRLFFKTAQPVASKRLTASNDRIIVHMPSAAVSKLQLKALEDGTITQAQLDKGYRVRPAWELEIMSEGKQVVLPPSIHPDTGNRYKYIRGFQNTKEIPFVASLPAAVLSSGNVKKESSQAKSFAEFSPVVIDYLDPRFSEQTTRLIFGQGVEDRSAACFSVAISMVRAGFSDNEILSVLTDSETFLGETAYQHRKTQDRRNAAAWARDYCLAKAKREADAAAVFENVAIEEPKLLPKKEAEAQKRALVRQRPWQERLTRTGKDGEGPPRPTLENTLLILCNAVSPKLFRRDEFSYQDFYGYEAPWVGGRNGKAVTDDDIVAIKEWFGARFRFEPSSGTIYDAVTAIAIKNSFHPVQEELRALPPWDCKPRIDTWLKTYFGAEGPDEYLAQVFRKWLVASITRTFEPGAKFDWLPIFEGKQGNGKSSFGAILFGQKYFSDWLPNLSDKDAALGLTGKLCVEFAELDRLRRSEIATVKAFVTRQFDIVRPPYGRKTVNYPRGCVFFGTVNEKEYLQDDTGNRRFNPIKVGALNFAALQRDREQLWAEALFIYDMGLEPSLYLENEAINQAEVIQREKEVKDDSDLMAELIADWLRREESKPAEERTDTQKIKIVSLFDSWGPLGRYKLDMRAQKLAGKAMKKLISYGYKSEKLHTREGKFWSVTPCDP